MSNVSDHLVGEIWPLQDTPPPVRYVGSAYNSQCCLDREPYLARFDSRHVIAFATMSMRVQAAGSTQPFPSIYLVGQPPGLIVPLSPRNERIVLICHCLSSAEHDRATFDSELPTLTMTTVRRASKLLNRSSPLSLSPSSFFLSHVSLLGTRWSMSNHKLCSSFYSSSNLSFECLQQAVKCISIRCIRCRL